MLLLMENISSLFVCDCWCWQFGTILEMPSPFLGVSCSWFWLKSITTTSTDVWFSLCSLILLFKLNYAYNDALWRLIPEIIFQLSCDQLMTPQEGVCLDILFNHMGLAISLAVSWHIQFFKLCFVLLHSRATVVTRASVVCHSPLSVSRHHFLGEYNRIE